MNPTTTAMLNCLDKARAEQQPFPHWLLEDVLSTRACAGIADLPIEAPQPDRYDGTRECNNQSRTYLNAELCSTSAVCQEVVDALKDERSIAKFERVCGTDLSNGNLRIEYTQDTDGFRLEPHTDIGVKLFTMLVYLSEEPELADAGTDLYDADHEHAGRAPFARNLGLIFIPGDDTWHGFAERPIPRVRRSIIVNYVTDDWRERWQLAP